MPISFNVIYFDVFVVERLQNGTNHTIFYCQLATDNFLSEILTFDVNNELYKGRLLVKHQIEESARNKEIVCQTEDYFAKWLCQIQLALIEGQQITEQPADVGPRQELEHWRRMLSKYTAALEFIDTKPFENHLQCLTLSRSKVAKVNKLENSKLYNSIFNSVNFRSGVLFTIN